jgi:hypothetical protein
MHAFRTAGGPFMEEMKLIGKKVAILTSRTKMALPTFCREVIKSLAGK